MIIKNPYVTEKVTGMIDSNNSMEFIVDIKANKSQIKKELEGLYGVDVVSVRTMVTPHGQKKAIVKLAGERSANELATRLGLL
ncbi:MAG: 50S ribosomal protein L23P [Methanosaeta sp. PtaB.Bin039]|nr:MAG: 50S ribosomal protein L23P [Methanosaeta sp. PtaB.Bin039]HOT07474.1 50S ribosomal protein L23 [Methanotrichaceae archaeon]HQF17001.1 50S ribosomal protein L23 [Methanotrichaceae archaeon]HQI91621.1 50S ribosomal protein L23 [Methanotrichaceae archaeon]HQJ28885.1 50S ribosomal protein L23 [Methanotrichaceae archaeon]